MTDTFDSPAPQIPRDRWGRPLVVPPGGGKTTPYTRCTTYVGVLEDLYNLHRWDERNVALGLADRPDLILAVAANRSDKDALNGIVADAKDAAKAGAAATIGTSLHALTEPLDRGQRPGVVPEAYRADLAAYERETACLEVVGIERFTVHDELKIGGTHDRTVRYQGRDFIADIKTGSITYGALKIAMQLAVYSRSVLYDPRTHTRTALDVDQDQALVIHLPAGEGRCELFWVDILAGWAAVQVAAEVRVWRARKDLFKPFDATPNAASVADEITQAATVAELDAVWPRHRHAWRDEYTTLAKARKAELLGSIR